MSAEDNGTQRGALGTIGFIGAGAIAQAFARQVLRAGYRAILSNSRGPETLTEAIQALGPGARARPVNEAASASIVVLAVQWPQVSGALEGLPPWDGRILIDATNPLSAPDYRMANLGGKTSSEIVASIVPGARLVKALNTLNPAHLGADPREGGGNRVIFMSGDDASAKSEVAQLLETVGYAPVDLGGLVVGGLMQQFPGGPLTVHNLVRLP
jgi:predicted dinucleotide-binding enzyme